MPNGRSNGVNALARLGSALCTFGEDTLGRRSFRATVCAAAAIGFLYGALVHPIWSEAVEFGQVWAGTVTYDSCNPWYPVVLSSPSLQITLPGLLLSAGFDPWYLSILFSGLFSAVAFAAIAAATFCFSSSSALALCVPLLPLGKLFLDTHGYPISFPLAYFQLGQTGLYLALLSIALIAAGRQRTGAFLGGLLMGVHLVWGVAFIAAAVPAALRLGLGRARIPIVVFLAATALAAGIQWAGHAVFPPRVDAACASKEATTAPLRTTFNAHSPLFAEAPSPLAAAAKFFMPDVLFVLAAAAWIFSTSRRGDHDAGMSLLIMASVPIAIAAAFKIVEELDPTFYVLGWLDPRLPSLVLRAIVTRWLNLTTALLPLLAIATAFVRTQSHRVWWMGGLAALFAISMLKFAVDAAVKPRFSGQDKASALVAEARKDAGQLVVSPDVVGIKGFNPQLRTGRAIIVPTMINVVDPDRGTSIAVFCYTDYLLPFADFYRNVRPCFEGRSQGEWRAIAEKLPATGLITPSDWHLSLPVAATAGGFNYYRLPR